mmetsp:Transcript_47982/g.95754  ORF Transcript_47982/g.95754 Transcript_47982/m.95754 type:complete len:304 (-) Transcript_47982:474-1385(-)
MQGPSLALLCTLPCDSLSFHVVRPRVSSSCTYTKQRASVRLNEEAADNGLSASDNEFLAYWRAHSAKWATPLRLLDVSAAWECGELDGMLPSGRPSRVSTATRFLTLGRAVELFENGELQVRRRFRNMTPVEMAPRWDRVMATRARLQRVGTWDEIVRESDKARAYERALVRGEVEDTEASPAFSRVVAMALSPALKAAAIQRARADGGLRFAFAELLETAGDSPPERWLTAVLLAELEGELESEKAAKLGDATLGATASPSFTTLEAQRNVEQATRFGLTGVGAAVIIAVQRWRTHGLASPA